MINALRVWAGSLRLVRRDPMLLMLLVAPFLAGAAFRLGLPPLADWLWQRWEFDLSHWYGLADLLLMLLTPMLAGALGGFLLLDERDEGVGAYYPVTPLGNGGYLITRLALPVAWCLLVTPPMMALCSLTHPPHVRMLAASLAGGPLAMTCALLLLAFAGNKVEGLAVSKMLGITMAPALVPLLVSSPWGALAGVFPAYWVGALLTGPLWQLAPALLVGALWLILLYRRMDLRHGVSA